MPKEYEAIKFSGFDNVHLSFSQLKLILSGEKYTDYRSALMGVKGIYCFTDTNPKREGKLYIGSAYGENGIAQRWSVYLDTINGGNQALVEPYIKEGEKYFITHFKFTLIEFFSKNTDIAKIIIREQYWKEAFSTKDFGNNRN